MSSVRKDLKVLGYRQVEPRHEAYKAWHMGPLPFKVWRMGSVSSLPPAESLGRGYSSPPPLSYTYALGLGRCT